MPTTLDDPKGAVTIDDLPNGRRRVRVVLADANEFSPRLEIETDYSIELIAKALEVKGAAYLCDEIAREQDPRYVGARLERMLFAYAPPERFAGRRLLDFGCGSGASTMILARLLPRTEIVGVELHPKLLELARARAEFQGTGRMTLLASPSGLDLPGDVGQFDFITMNAVYEHLLPAERRAIMPKLWDALAPGGLLFLDETPNRAYHVEGHTTGLPLLNYLPDSLALAYIRRFSKRMRTLPWESLLRSGVRGGTEREVLRMLALDGGPAARAVEPKEGGYRDRIDLYFAGAPTTPLRRARIIALKGFKRLTGITYTRSLMLALKKPD